MGGAEIACGALIITGLLTRFAAFVLLIDITVAIVSTRIPILLGSGFWDFSLTKLPRYGFLSMIHEARTDLACGLVCYFSSLSARAGNRRWTKNLTTPRQTDLE